MNLKLKKFDMRTVKPNSVLYFAAKRRSGKSVLMKDYLYHHRDVPGGCIISCTEEANPFYSDFVPKLFIHDEYSPELLARYVKRQRMVAKMVKDDVKQYGESRIDPRSFLILDDALHDPSWKNDKNIKYCFFNGRHVNTSLLIASQSILDPAKLRDNIIVCLF